MCGPDMRWCGTGRFVWGRGAIDLKSNVVAILHAVNQLAAYGFRPRRSFFVALGHDEEVIKTHRAPLPPPSC